MSVASPASTIRGGRMPARSFWRSRQTMRALWAGWKADLAGAAEYRVDLVTGTLVSTIWLGISVAPVLIVAAHTDGAGGWTVPRLLFLQAAWYLMDAMVWVVLILNVGYWEEQVTQGTLDGLLLRPVNSLVICSMSKLHVPDIPKVFLAIGLGTWAVVEGGGPVGWSQSIAAVVAIICGMVLMWAFAVLANYKVLTHVQFDGWSALFAGLNLARVPTPLYGSVLRVVLTAVIPVAFLATVPAQVFFGDVGVWLAAVSVALAAGSIVLVSWLWRRELAKYSGAMG